MVKRDAQYVRMPTKMTAVSINLRKWFCCPLFLLRTFVGKQYSGARGSRVSLAHTHHSASASDHHTHPTQVILSEKKKREDPEARTILFECIPIAIAVYVFLDSFTQI